MNRQHEALNGKNSKVGQQVVYSIRWGSLPDEINDKPAVLVAAVEIRSPWQRCKEVQEDAYEVWDNDEKNVDSAGRHEEGKGLVFRSKVHVLADCAKEKSKHGAPEQLASQAAKREGTFPGIYGLHIIQAA